MELGLNGRTVLITGASQGVGRETARMLAAEGCELILVARSKRDLEAVRESILSEHQVAIAATVCDIGRPGAAELIFAEHPEIDILINNAGAVPAGAIDQVDEPAWRVARSEEHTSELQSLMRISYAVFCLKKKKQRTHTLQ